MEQKLKLALIIAIGLLMAGCQNRASEETTGTPTTFPVVAYENDIGIAPDDLFPFCYSEDIIALLGSLDCDPGYLYVYCYSAKEVTQITDFPVLDLTETLECIFYVTEDYRIVRTNYAGDYHEVIYTAAYGAIPKIEYGYGKLTFPDGDHVIVMDLNAGTCKGVFQLEKLEMVQHCAVGTNLFIRADGDFLGLDYSTGKTCRFSSNQEGYDFMNQGIWPETEKPNILPIEWQMKSVWIGSDGQVGDSLDISVIGEIRDYADSADDVNLDFVFPANFRYRFGTDETEATSNADLQHDLDYFVVPTYGYDSEINAPEFCIYALSTEKEYLIIKWSNQDKYLVASTHLDTTPLEIFQYFHRFVEVYTSDGWQ